MAASKRSLGACFGGIREATCKGNRPLEAYAKRIGCVCVEEVRGFKLSIEA